MRYGALNDGYMERVCLQNFSKVFNGKRNAIDALRKRRVSKWMPRLWRMRSRMLFVEEVKRVRGSNGCESGLNVIIMIFI